MQPASASSDTILSMAVASATSFWSLWDWSTSLVVVGVVVVVGVGVGVVLGLGILGGELGIV